MTDKNTITEVVHGHLDLASRVARAYARWCGRPQAFEHVEAFAHAELHLAALAFDPAATVIPFPAWFAMRLWRRLIGRADRPAPP